MFHSKPIYGVLISGSSSKIDGTLVGLSRVLFEEHHSGTQHHVTTLKGTLELNNVIITSSIQKADIIFSYRCAHYAIQLFFSIRYG
jgi:hypothetical protein